MEKRKLGRSGLEVAPLAFGGNVFGWTVDEPTSFSLLDAFTDAGFDLVDTADVYSAWAPGNRGGESETIIGNWLKRSGRRDKVVIATKLGSEMGPGRKGLSRDYVFRAVEESLKRLQTDYIDLYQSHYDDPDTAQEETAQAFADLVRQGKVRAIGASNFTAARLRSAVETSERLGLPRYESLQPLYNLYDRSEFEGDLQALCLEKGIGVISYFSLASGFLTGKYRTQADLGKSKRGGGIGKYLDDKGRRILAALDQVSARHDATPAQVSLAWLLAKPGITAPIASATSVTQLEDLLAATRIGLDAESVKLLDEAGR